MDENNTYGPDCDASYDQARGIEESGVQVYIRAEANEVKNAVET